MNKNHNQRTFSLEEKLGFMRLMRAFEDFMSEARPTFIQLVIEEMLEKKLEYQVELNYLN